MTSISIFQYCYKDTVNGDKLRTLQKEKLEKLYKKEQLEE